MSLDSAAARWSCVGVNGPWNVGVYSDATTPQAWRQASGFCYAGVLIDAAATGPEDPDDATVTARVDRLGATVRPARMVVSHAADGVRNADQTGHDRVTASMLDRHRLRSSREARNPNVGSRFVVRMRCCRAGEAFALDRLIVWLSPEEARPRAADTTTRSDVLGCTEKVHAVRCFVSADAERNADLSTIGGTVQDRWVARFAIPSGQGLGQRFKVRLREGAAGNAWALDRLIAWVSDEADSRPGVET